MTPNQAKLALADRGVRVAGCFVLTVATTSACKPRAETSPSDGGALASAVTGVEADASARNEGGRAMLKRAYAEASGGHWASARETFVRVQQQFPGSPEAAQASAAVALQDQFKPDAQDDPVLPPGIADAGGAIRSLKAARTFVDDAGSRVHVNDVSVAREWESDNFGDGDQKAVADKGNVFVIVSFDVQSKEKDPKLSCPVVLLRDPAGMTFHRPDDTSISFRRWDSYASLLGNNSDLGNDFAKTDNVKFSAGVQVRLDDLAHNLLYVVFRKTPRLSRHEERFHRPPVWYDGECAVPENLAVDDVLRDFDVVEVRGPRSY